MSRAKLHALRARVDALGAVRERGSFRRAIDAMKQPWLAPLELENEALRAWVESIRKPATGPLVVPFRELALEELEGNVADCEKRVDVGLTIELRLVDALLRTIELLAKSDLHVLVTTGPADQASPVGLRFVDSVLAMAMDERTLPDRRRKLFEAGRRALLDLGAATALPHPSIVARRRAVARELELVDRAVAAGLGEHASVLHQARIAYDKRDAKALVAALWWIETLAETSGDREVRDRARTLRSRFFAGADPDSAKERAASREASLVDAFGDTAMDALRRAFDAAERGPELERVLRGMLSADGTYELGGRLSPFRMDVPVVRDRRVRYPTARLSVEHAESIEDVHSAFIDDPRTVLHDLASGKLLTRRFLERETVLEKRATRVAEARYFLLDGSSSMNDLGGGDRGRARDAILLSEIATALRRLEVGGRATRVVLFYRYFMSGVDPMRRVSDVAEAKAEIDHVVSTVRGGGTNIQGALLRCFADIRAAVDDDPDLSRAQIVLVTDGMSEVKEEALTAAREALGELPVRVSVIAIGDQNDALRAIVARQRALGEEAFYQYLDDDEIAKMLGRLDDASALHRPAGASDDPFEGPDGEAFHREAGTLLDELAAISRARHVEELVDARAEAAAFAEAALEIEYLPGPALSGRLAREESFERDARALEARFDRWFPATTPDAGATHDPGVVADVAACLHGIAEVARLVGADPLARRADALELLERMLPAMDLDFRAYTKLVAGPPSSVADALSDLRAAVVTQT